VSLKFISILLLFHFCFYYSCEEKLTPPNSLRLDFVVIAQDTTGFMELLEGKTFVDSARVFVNSYSYHNTYEDFTDENGQVVFQSILPDRYSVSITRFLSPDEVMKVTGVRIARVLNGQIKEIEVSGGVCSTTVYLYPSQLGSIVFSEIYYNGAPPPPPYYYHDQFTELYNNSDSVMYLDGLIIADVEYGYVDDEYIHAVHAYMFPGSGTDYPLNPGEFVIIAQDAIDHTEANANSVDLSDADFEYYAPNQPDVDNPDVENMIMVHHKYGYDFLYSVMNCGIVLLRVDDPYAVGYDNFDNILFPKENVIDGVEYRDNLSEVEYKRLSSDIDAGLTGGFEAYRGKSIERKIGYYREGRAILLDNNNSSIDFEVLSRPTPGYIHGVEGSGS